MARMVIVGGGVVGTMHALEARRRGHEVVQLDRDAEPRSASVRNFGLVWVSGRAPGAELATALRARARWEEIGADVPGVGFRPDGSLTVATQSEELAVLEQVAEGPDADARGVRVVDPAEARRLNPAVRGQLLGALYCDRDAVVEPRQVLPAVRAHLGAGAGTGYRFLAPCTAVEVTTGAVTDSGGERHRADLVLVCPGAELDGPLAGLVAGAGLRRCRLQMLQTAPFPERLGTALADGDSLRYYPAFQVPAAAGLPEPDPIVARFRAQLLVAQRASGALTIGDTHDYDEPFDFALDDEPYQHLQGRAEAILGQPLPPVVRRWSGVYSLCTGEQVCHRSEPLPGVVVVTGLAGRGMTLSPAVAIDTFDEVGL